MPFAYNVIAFRAISEGAGGSSLVRAYCGLMVIELCIKDVLSCHGLKHDIQRMLQRLGQEHPPATRNRGALNSLASRLSNVLSALPCQSLANSASMVRPTVFPDMRYIRHNSDWSAPTCSDAELDTLRRLVDELRHFLRKQCQIGNAA
jgi:hypothetical protein